MNNQPIIFRRDKWIDFLICLLCTTFTAIGVFLLEKNPVVAWLGIVFFGLGTLAFFWQLLTDSAYLKLTDEDFEVKSLFRKQRLKWSDMKGLRAGNARGRKMIIFDYTEAYYRRKKGSKLSFLWSGNHGAIHATYTIKRQALLELMQAYKHNSTSRRGHTR